LKAAQPILGAAFLTLQGGAAIGAKALKNEGFRPLNPLN